MLKLSFQKGVAICRCRKSFLVGKWCGYLVKMVWLSGGGGENDSSVNSLVKESRLLKLSLQNEFDLKWT